jgi:hypothetical protein
MSHGDVVSREGDEGREPDVLVFGGPRHDPGPRLRRAARLVLPLALAAVAVAAAVAHGTGGTPAPQPSAVVGLAPSAGFGTPAPGPTVVEAGRPLLGVSAGWELLGWGPDGVVRVQLAPGRVTRTAVPALDSSGPTSFVVGRDWAIVRPLDVVPAYVVRDGQPARPLTGALGRSGPGLPGPDPDHLWVANGAGAGAEAILVDATGRPTGASVPVNSNGFPEPDGAGYVLLRGPAGSYTARPGSRRRITTGDLLAVGPIGWLTRECGERSRCAMTFVDRATGTGHPLGGPPVEPSQGSTGVISPDGAIAALPAATTVVGVTLLGLATGTAREVKLPAGLAAQDATMAWSPDSRWLFVAARDGRVYPIDAATGQVHDLGVVLPPLSQIAIRAAA